MWSAFNAFEFWKCANSGLMPSKDVGYWWDEFVSRRAKAMGIPVGHKKFPQSKSKGYRMIVRKSIIVRWFEVVGNHDPQV